MKSRSFRTWLKFTLLGAGMGLVVFVVIFYYNFNNYMRDLYTPSSAANLVIGHMQANGGAWPRSWDELHTTFVSDPQWRTADWDDLRRRVGIDFTADAARLAAASDGEPPHRVIWSAAYPDARLPGRPNDCLRAFVRKQQGERDADGDQSVSVSCGNPRH
jgi:hypothetical protein